eukprot:m.141273 g.141273  ORF g.141273 m.141273 type:complete len:291 (+) comp14035_c0_seq34:262-1134(+)
MTACTPQLLTSQMFNPKNSSAVLPGDDSVSYNALSYTQSTEPSSPLLPNTDEDIDPDEFVYDVIVIGGGLSGLTAALEVKQAGFHPLVLEAKDRVGGRTCTTTLEYLHGVDACDIGGQWVSQSQPEILRLVEKYGLETYKQDDAGTHLIQFEDGHAYSYKGFFPYRLGFGTLLGALTVMGLTRLFSSRIVTPFTGLIPNSLKHLDQLTVAQAAKKYGFGAYLNQVLGMLTNVCQCMRCFMYITNSSFGLFPRDLFNPSRLSYGVKLAISLLPALYRLCLVVTLKRFLTSI